MLASEMGNAMDGRRLKIKVGSPVIAKDGNCGYLRQVILDPDQKKVIGLVVKPDHLAKFTVIVPMDQVADATEDDVRLRLDPEQVFSLARFQDGSPFFIEDKWYLVGKNGPFRWSAEERMVSQAPGPNHGRGVENPIAQGCKIHPAIRLCPGQSVLSRNRRIGRVNFFFIQPNGQIISMVIQARSLPPRELIVPIEWIQAVEQRFVKLSEDQQVLDRLQEYVPDKVLTREINQVIRGENLPQATQFSEMTVKVQDGIVSLFGHVPTPHEKVQIENAVRCVAGVLRIESRLVADYDLTIRVAQALGEDERMRLARITVNTRNGVVTLSGRVENASLYYLAEGIAARVPSVRGVMNDIQIPGISRNPIQDRFLQPLISQEVLATDLCLGTVEKVIIDPHNQRVTAFVVHGKFPDPNLMQTTQSMREDFLKERQVVLPVGLIRYESDTTVFLNIDGLAAAGYGDYNDAQYAPAPDDWQPPYPYTIQDLLFEGHTKRLLEDLHILAEQGINSRQRIIAAGHESKEMVEAMIRESREEAKARQEVVKAVVMERLAVDAGQWDEIQENFQQKAQQIKNMIENEPQAAVNAAESYAEAAIGFTILAIDVAEAAMLEAIETSDGTQPELRQEKPGQDQ